MYEVSLGLGVAVSSPDSGVYGVGRWLLSRVSLPQSGVYEVGTWFPSPVSLPRVGVYEASLGSGVAASSPFAHIKPVPASQQAPALCFSNQVPCGM